MYCDKTICSYHKEFANPFFCLPRLLLLDIRTHANNYPGRRIAHAQFNLNNREANHSFHHHHHLPIKIRPRSKASACATGRQASAT